MKEPETTSRVEGEAGARRTPRGRRAARRGGARSANGRKSTGGATMDQFIKENASSLTFLGVTLGVFLSRKFLILPVAVGLMLAQEHLAMAGLERVRRAVRS